jgi:cell division protein FtsL
LADAFQIYDREIEKLRQQISKEYGRLQGLRKERHDLTRMHDMERDLNNFIEITVPHLQQEIRDLREKNELLEKQNEELQKENAIRQYAEEKRKRVVSHIRGDVRMSDYPIN